MSNVAILKKVDKSIALEQCIDTTLQECLSKIPDSVWALPEEDLVDVLKPTQTVEMLRLRLWDLYLKHRLKGDKKVQKKRITVSDLCEGICSLHFFKYKISKSSHLLCYVLTPPRKFEELYKASLYRSLNRISEILETSPFDDKGKPRMGLMKLQARIFDNFQVLVHGKPDENINIRQQSTIHNAAAVEINQLYQKGDMAELEKIVKKSNVQDRLLDTGDDTEDEF